MTKVFVDQPLASPGSAKYNWMFWVFSNWLYSMFWGYLWSKYLGNKAFMFPCFLFCFVRKLKGWGHFLLAVRSLDQIPPLSPLPLSVGEASTMQKHPSPTLPCHNHHEADCNVFRGHQDLPTKLFSCDQKKIFSTNKWSRLSIFCNKEGINSFEMVKIVRTSKRAKRSKRHI